MLQWRSWPCHRRLPRIRGDGGRVLSRVHRHCNDFLVLNNDTNDTECVVNCTFKFVNDVFSTALDDNGYRLGILALLDKGHLFAGNLAFLDESCLTEFFLANRINRRDEAGTGRTGEFLHVTFLDPSGCKDACLCKIVLGNVINTFLAEEDGCTACDNLVDNTSDHPLFFIQECLELVGAGNVDLSVNFGLLELDCCVQ